MIPFYPMIFPIIPTMNTKPPTLYSILNSIVNYGKEENEQSKIKDLAKNGYGKIFDFDYPLSSKIKKEDFECLILNHFLMRRIGFDTVTAFKIQLNVKLNEIMPIYNKMFDALENWNLFEDGEKTTIESTDNRTTDNNTETTNTAKTTNTLKNTSETTTNDTNDRRESELPQNEIQNIKDGSYLTKYNLDSSNSTSNDNSTSDGTSESNGTTNTTNNIQDDNKHNETIIKTPSDKIAIYKEFQENLKSIYTMIFKDLDCLFYQLV